MHATLGTGPRIDALIGARLTLLGQEERRHELQYQRHTERNNRAARCTVATLFFACVCIACCSRLALWALASRRRCAKVKKRRMGHECVLKRSTTEGACDRIPAGVNEPDKDVKEGTDADDSDDDEIWSMLLKDKLFA